MKISEVKIDDIKICKQLCDELMAFQKSQANIHKEYFDLMNFETRMLASAKNAKEMFTLLLSDGNKSVGYIFSTIDYITTRPSTLPLWVLEKDKKMHGFYPDWMEFPAYVGCLNNLYIKDEYQGLGFANKLMEKTLQWFKEQDKVDYVMVYVSNGNDDAIKFYQKYGFTLSHNVFAGFISALFLKNK